MVQAQPWVPSPNELQRPPGSEAGRRRLPSLKATNYDLQPVGSPAWGAGDHLAGLEGGQHLCPGMLEPAKHPVSRLQPRLDSQELLLKRPIRVRRDVDPHLTAPAKASKTSPGGGGGGD